MQRQNISSGSPFEPIVGYSRAVRVGNTGLVAGTTATDENGNLVGVGDPKQQTVQILNNIEAALTKAGAKLEHVVRTRIFVTDIENWEPIGLVHGQVFKDIRPVCTMVEVSKLISPDMVVEIEAEAMIPG